MACCGPPERLDERREDIGLDPGAADISWTGSECEKE